MKSQGFFQTPQDIMDEYNGCSVPQYRRYRRDTHSTRGYTDGGTELIITKPRVVKV